MENNYEKSKIEFFKRREINAGTNTSIIWDNINSINAKIEELKRQERLWRTSLIIVSNNKLREEKEISGNTR
jgi:hypothetical protein